MRAVAVGLFLFMAGCGASDQYLTKLPVVGDSVVRGMPAADYAVPAVEPRGDVQIVSFGVTTLKAKPGATATPVLELRFVVSNADDPVPWLVDTRNLVVDLGRAGTSRPAMVNTDRGAPPFIAITQGEERVLDLYYPLPALEARAAALRSFDVIWQVETGAGQVAHRTDFRRGQVDPGVYAYYPRDLPASAYSYEYDWTPDDYWDSLGFAVGLGSVWWYDPFYPSYAFQQHTEFHWAPGHHAAPPVAGLAGLHVKRGRLVAHRTVPTASAAGGATPRR